MKQRLLNQKNLAPVAKHTAMFLLSFVMLAFNCDQNARQLSAPEDDNLQKVKNEAFTAGEVLTYRLHYGFLDAGVARIEVKKKTHKVGKREVYHVVGTGRTIGATDWFFKVRDRYETYIDREGVFPWLFIRRVDEGGYKINQNYTFHQYSGVVDNGEGKKFATPAGVQDMLSSFYYVRTLDFTNAVPGQVFTVQSFVDDEIYPLKIKYMGKETIKVRKGKFRCMRFVPVVQEGRIFKEEEDMQVWITDDKNKIPILAKADILVGSIKMEILDYKGLANPIARVEK